VVEGQRQPLEAGGVDVDVAQADGAGEGGVADELGAFGGEGDDAAAAILGVAADSYQFLNAQLVDGLAESCGVHDKRLAEGGEGQLRALAQDLQHRDLQPGEPEAALELERQGVESLFEPNPGHDDRKRLLLHEMPEMKPESLSTMIS